MRLLAPLCLVAALCSAGCGGGSPSPETVVRAWSQSINSGDNEAAAMLFARGAKVVQSGRVVVLRTYNDALRWNAALPCSGKILSISGDDETAKATFLLADRETSRCDGPGSRASAIVRVRAGKIVLWHQTETERPDGGPV